MESIKFEKVSFEQFVKDWKNMYEEDMPNLDCLKAIYDGIKLPKRGTEGSAGYDFFMPFEVSLEKGESIFIPTGIRAILPKDKVLMMFPRSGQGSKCRLMIMNTVGIVDSDYQFAENEGHIMMKMIHDGFDNNSLMSTIPFVNEIKKTRRTKVSPAKIHLEKGKGFCQGIITNYFITDDDGANEKRTGGYGSTDKA